MQRYSFINKNFKGGSTSLFLCHCSADWCCDPCPFYPLIFHLYLTCAMSPAEKYLCDTCACELNPGVTSMEKCTRFGISFRGLRCCACLRASQWKQEIWDEHGCQRCRFTAATGHRNSIPERLGPDDDLDASSCGLPALNLSFEELSFEEIPVEEFARITFEISKSPFGPKLAWLDDDPKRSAPPKGVTTFIMSKSAVSSQVASFQDLQVEVVCLQRLIRQLPAL